MVGRYAADVGEEAALCGADHVHHAVWSGPLLRRAQHPFKQALTGFVLGQLEVVRALVACQGEQDDPFPVVVEEGGHAVFSHVRGHRQGVEVHLFKEGTGVHGRRVADVAPLGVSYDELVGVVLFQVGYRLLEGGPAFQPAAFIEGEVRLVGHAVGGRSVDDGLVEGKDGVLFAEQVGGDFLHVCVEADAEERRFAAYVPDEFFSVHGLEV